MLINFSNHPVKDWSDDQLKTARRLYETIVDLPFPKIDPDGDENYITDLSKKYSGYIIEKLRISPHDKNAVHVMGEHTLIFTLINSLTGQGVKCIASTTERNTQINNEAKISKFNFVRFREYTKNV